MESTYFSLNPWWESKKFDFGITRKPYLAKLPEQLKLKQVEIYIGSRRIGKTTLLKQFVRYLLNNRISEKDIFYLALDQPVLSGTTISEHLKNMRRIFRHDRERKLYLFLDEVQESPQWEMELKALYDTEQLKIFCSGSTSSLITRQGGKLTGRQIVNTVYPLDFREFITFREDDPPSRSEDYKYEQLADDYLMTGGYPEYVINPSLEYLSNLLEDILARDLIRLYSIKKPYVLKDLLRLVGASIGNIKLFEKIQRQATTDGLTGLVNHKTFYEILEKELWRSRRYGGLISLIMIDIDNLKSINDAYGHRAGDKAIRKISKKIKECIRQIDTAARYGGDEFAVILLNTSLDDATVVAQRMVDAVASSQTTWQKEQIPLSISVGLGQYDAETTPEDITSRSDQALYMAKQAGKNTVRIFESQKNDQ